MSNEPIFCDEMSYSVIFIMEIISYLLFIIQFILCLKVKKIAIKLIPVYIIVLVIITTVVLYTGVFGTEDYFSEQQIYIIFYLCTGAAAALVGDALAWIAYFISLKIERQ